TMLVPVDGSSRAARAARLAAALATALQRAADDDAKLRIHLLNISAYAEPGWSPTVDQVDLGALAARLGRDLPGGIDITHETRSAPFASEGISEQVARLVPDLVVMGTQGSGPFVRALLGSTALHVAQTLVRPILLVPRP